MIKSLEYRTQQNLRSGVAIASFAQCVDELVLNAVDAGATCIATRVDLNQGKVQVVDNGRGISRDDLNRVCERYHTSKCSSLADVERDLQHYGYRGEALASMRSMCFLLEIETRARADPTTYSKLFREREKAEIRESRVHRPSAGTTITVYDLFYTMPVRKKSLNESLEFERIRQRLEAIALIHPKLSFSLRNDQTCSKVLQTHKANSVVGAFSHLFGNGKARSLCEVKHADGDFQIHGYIGKESHHNKALQFVYINDRLVLKTRIHKQVTQLLSKTIMMKKKHVNAKQDSKTNSQYSPEGISPRRYAEKHGMFVLNITCPLSAYDVTFDPAKTLVEFKDWDRLLNCTRFAIDRFIDDNSLRANVDLTSNNSQDFSDCVTIGESQDSQSEEKPYGYSITTSDITNNLQSRTVYRLAKKLDPKEMPAVEPVPLQVDDRKQSKPHGNKSESTQKSNCLSENLSDDDDGAIPGKALIRGRIGWEKRAKSLTASNKIPDATSCSTLKSSDDLASDRSPLAFLYKSTDEGTGRKRSNEVIVISDSCDTPKPQDSTVLTQSPGDIHVSIPSTPSQLLKSRSQRKVKQPDSSQGHPMPRIKETKVGKIGQDSFKSGLGFKSGSAKSPVDQIRSKYKKMYSKSKSPIQKTLQRSFDAFDEDPLSGIKTTSSIQTNDQASTSNVSQNISKSRPLSNQTKSKILSSLELIRARIKAKAVAQKRGLSSDSDEREQTCKKHSDISKHKCSNRNIQDDTPTSAPNLKIAKFNELQKRLSSVPTRASLEGVTGNHSSEVPPVIEQSKTVIEKKCLYNNTADTKTSLLQHRSPSQVLVPASTHSESGDKGVYPSHKQSDNRIRGTGASSFNSSLESTARIGKENRKRNMFETPKGSNSISAKLARLSKGCSDCDTYNQAIPEARESSQCERFADEVELFKQKFALFRNTNASSSKSYTPKRTPCSQSSINKMESLTSSTKPEGFKSKFMTTADFVTTPENFDFDTALKSLESSQASMHSDDKAYCQAERLRDKHMMDLSEQHPRSIGRDSLSQSEMRVDSPEEQYVIHDSYVDDEDDDSGESFHMFPIKLPSLDEMDTIVSGDEKIRSTSHTKQTEHRLFCHESPLLSDSTVDENKDTPSSPGRKGSESGNKSVTITVYTPSVGDIIAHKTSNSDIVAHKTSNSDIVAHKTSNSDIVAHKTSNSDIVAHKTSNSDIVAHKTSNSDIVAHKTSNSDIVAHKTSNSDIVAHKTSNSDIVAHKTSNSDIVAHKTSSSDIVAHKTSNSDIVAHKTSNSDIVAHKTSNSKSMSSKKASCSSLLTDMSTSEYNVQYIPLSEVESIQYIGPATQSESVDKSQVTHLPEATSLSSKLSARVNKGKIYSEEASSGRQIEPQVHGDSYTPLKCSQGFSTANEIENTQPFDTVRGTQGFEAHNVNQSVIREGASTEHVPSAEGSVSLSMNSPGPVHGDVQSHTVTSDNGVSINPDDEYSIQPACNDNVIEEQCPKKSPQMDNSDNTAQTHHESSPELELNASVASEPIKEETFTPFGQDWVCKVDTRSGRKIYVNLKTGNSSFDPPPIQDTTGTCDMISGRNKVRLLTQNSGQFMKCDRVSTLARSRDVKADTSLGNSSEVSHLVEDHLEAQAEEDGVKWRNPKNDFADDKEGEQSIVQLFEDWENPAFRNVEQDVVNAEAGNKARRGQWINSSLNPQTFTKEMLKSIKVLRQMDKKFIACMIETKTEAVSDGPEMLIVIDQHAAHERVRLEKMTHTTYEDEERKQILSCKVVPAVQISLAEEYVRLMEAYRKQFSRMGLEFKKEDLCTISAHVVPAMLVERELSESKKYCDPAWLPTQLEFLIKEQVDALQRTHGSVASLPLTLHKILCSRACKGAIKFGDKMTVEECEELIGQLRQCQLPFQCAHGRPSLMPLLNLDHVKRQCPERVSQSRPKLYKLKLNQ